MCKICNKQLTGQEQTICLECEFDLHTMQVVPIPEDSYYANCKDGVCSIDPNFKPRKAA